METDRVTTPGRLTLSRWHSYDVTVEKPGYTPVEVRVERVFNHALWGNFFLLLAAPVGILVDLLDGAAWDLEPPTVEVTLAPAAASQPDTPAAAASPVVLPTR